MEAAYTEFESIGASKDDNENEGDENTAWTTVAKGRVKRAKMTVQLQSSKPNAYGSTTSQFVVGGRFEDKKMYLGDLFDVAQIKKVLCTVDSVRVTRSGIL